MNTPTLRIGHSPDPDDAFMWYPLSNRAPAAALASSVSTPLPPDPSTHTDPLAPYQPYIDTHPYRFEHVLEDIQSLNTRAENAELEITAISIHQYPYVAEHYALTSCGSSMGDNYGPMLVTPADSPIRTVQDLLAATDRPIEIAIPGQRTTAYLVLRLMLNQALADTGHTPDSHATLERIQFRVLPFDQITAAVSQGRHDAGLIIHEGQLTYAQAGLKCLVDLGTWWTQSRGLPLPLGGNAIRRDLGEQPIKRICSILSRSIEYALEHRDEALGYALGYARDLDKDLADRFVGMYVNQWTLDYGPTGRRAVQQLLKEASDAGLTPPLSHIDFIEPDPDA